MTNEKAISDRLSSFGLIVRGTTSEDSSTIVLVGSAGSEFWRIFTTSPEYTDGIDDPLDRWSRRIGDAVADEFAAKALYPFGGPPYEPFLRWAMRAEPAEPSRLGMLIHPEYGLWHAYRFALRLQTESAVRESPSASQSGICDRCDGKPCAAACPVDAFAGDAYNVAACTEYLRANAAAFCNRVGCIARRRCPQAIDRQYDDDHAAFHMQAFVRAQSVVSGE